MESRIAAQTAKSNCNNKNWSSQLHSPFHFIRRPGRPSRRRRPFSASPSLIDPWPVQRLSIPCRQWFGRKTGVGRRFSGGRLAGILDRDRVARCDNAPCETGKDTPDRPDAARKTRAEGRGRLLAPPDAGQQRRCRLSSPTQASRVVIQRLERCLRLGAIADPQHRQGAQRRRRRRRSAAAPEAARGLAFDHNAHLR